MIGLLLLRGLLLIGGAAETAASCTRGLSEHGIGRRSRRQFERAACAACGEREKKEQGSRQAHENSLVTGI
jgi:hypothetical protein